MQNDLKASLSSIICELVPRHFPSAQAQQNTILPIVERAVFRTLDMTSTADCHARMQTVAAATTAPLVDFLSADATLTPELTNVTAFRTELAQRAADALTGLRVEYLEGARGPAPAAEYLGQTRAVYEFVRVQLGIRMHGAENLHRFELGPSVEEGTIGESVSLIHEAIRDGKLQSIVVQMAEALKEDLS
jgi:phenylalanine ammonia-lyase